MLTAVAPSIPWCWAFPLSLVVGAFVACGESDSSAPAHGTGGSAGADAQADQSATGGTSAADAGADAVSDASVDTTDGPPCDASCAGVCVGNICHTYPARRVGIFYLAWHAFAADTIAQLPAAQRLTVEDVIKSPNPSFDVLLPTPALAEQAAGFRYHIQPELGFYHIYRKRPGDAAYPEPNYVADGTNLEKVLRTHATQLWQAGVDFVYVDLTNLQGMSPFADVLGVRPLEVLFEEWAAARAAGIMTPQIAAWVPAPDKSGPMVYEEVSRIYHEAQNAELVLRDQKTGKKVVFLVDTLTTDSGKQDSEGAGGANDVVAVRMWGLLSKQKLDSGVASWMQPCEVAGSWTTIVEPQAACDQGFAKQTPIGSVLSVSSSYQLSYASLPFHAAGKRGGVTLKRQFAHAFQAAPDYLLINSWNELIAQPQPNPHPATMGNLRKSMGVYDSSGVSLWVDPYGAEYVRDIEPSVEYGDFYYQLMSSCLRVYRQGSCSVAGTSGESCCATDPELVLIRSLREKDPSNGMTTQHVLSTGTNERDTLVATGAWEEVCTPLLGNPQLCGGGPMTNADVPFELFASAGPERALLTRCFTGVSNFFSLDPSCEGTTVVGPLGYVAKSPSSHAARPLRRCYNTSAQRHFHWLDVTCPALPNVKEESLVGYVR